jgi:hypothetical protein
MRFPCFSSSFEERQANSQIANDLSVAHSTARCPANDCFCLANYVGRKTVDRLRVIEPPWNSHFDWFFYQINLEIVRDII